MPNPRRAPTLQDVARTAGVSTATVSRCLNAPDRVVEETRARVLEAVERLGYRPNFAARVMAARRSLTVGAIIPTMENAIFARGLQAFQEELLSRGYTLLVASSSYDAAIEEEQIRNLVSRGADGLLLIGHDRNPEILAFLDARGVPALAAWTCDPSGGLPSVGFDNRAAMAALTERVLAFGHRKIGIISAPTGSNDRARQRVEGILGAVARAGLDRDSIPVIETPYGIEQGGAAFREIMAPADPPTVVMCGNDVLAVGAIGAARDMGLSVPDDVSVTGFDDIEIARVVTPKLTTVHVPHRDMGRRAAAELVAMLEGRDGGQVVELPTDIRDRASLAGPRSAALPRRGASV